MWKIKIWTRKFPSFIKGVKVNLNGKNNKILRSRTSKFTDTIITVCGNNNVISFGENCSMRGLRILIDGDHNRIKIGNGVVVNANSVKPTVVNAIGGKSIEIGAGSLLSNNIEIHTSDYHGIYNAKGNRINPDQDIKIGRFVWIGLGVKILKGTVIADGSVVGAGSVLAGEYNKQNAVVCGNPAKVIQENIFWKSAMKDHCKVPGILRKKWSKI